MQRSVPFVVFSDVDGLLFDRSRRSFQDAAGALDALDRAAVPLILCSGKSRAQLEHLQQELGLSHPFIPEHGAAVYIPSGYFSHKVVGARSVGRYEVVEFGLPSPHAAETLYETAARLRIDVIGFRNMSADQIAALCEIPPADARLAKVRDYDEPFRILNQDVSRQGRLFKALHDANLRCRRGTRFEHAGAPVGLDVGVQLLATIYRQAFGFITTVGLGATADHAELLRAVDVAFVVRTDEEPAVSELSMKVPTARITAEPRVAGWARQVIQIIESVPHLTHI